MSLKVLKFGGSSVGSADALRRAAAIVREALPTGGLVVVSALKGATDRIQEACAAAGRGDLPGAREHLVALRDRHRQVASELGLWTEVRPAWTPLFERLDQLLTGMAMLGEALGAREVQIWTDVDGALTADPSLVAEAQPIPQMSLGEAEAISAFGAKVLHADSLAPGGRAGFRLVVANTVRPAASRTEILPVPPPRTPGAVTSVAYKEGLSLLRFPASEGLEPPLEAARRLEEAGACGRIRWPPCATWQPWARSPWAASSRGAARSPSPSWSPKPGWAT